MTFPADTKILIVDDLEDMRQAVTRSLHRLGYSNVIAATDGGEALACLEATPDVGLVISDWNMEPVDGLGLLEGMRKNPQFKTIPFILVSAEAGPYRANYAMEHGVSLFLPKPFDAEALRDAMARVVAGCG